MRHWPTSLAPEPATAQKAAPAALGNKSLPVDFFSSLEISDV
jgi:hypothetical protein